MLALLVFVQRQDGVAAAGLQLQRTARIELRQRRVDRMTVEMRTGET